MPIRIRFLSILGGKLKDEIQVPYEGKTLRDIILHRIHVRSVVAVDTEGRSIAPEAWSDLRPPDNSLVLIRLTPEGADGGDIPKETLRQIATFGFIGAGALISAPLSGIAQWATMAGTTFAGIALINTLIPIIEPEEVNPRRLTGIRNELRPYGVIPKLYGRRRITPPLGASPVTEVEGTDIWIRAVFVLGYRPIKVYRETMKIGDALVSELDDKATIEIVDGYDSPDEEITLFSNDIEEDRLDIGILHAPKWEKDTEEPEAEFGDDLTRDVYPAHENVVNIWTQPDTVEFNFDLTFPNGIAREEGGGGLSKHSVQLAFQYRASDDDTPGPWIDMIAPGVEELYNISASDYTMAQLFLWLDSWTAVLDPYVTTLESYADTETAVGLGYLVIAQSYIARIERVAAKLKLRDTISGGQTSTVDAALAVVTRIEALIDGSIATANGNSETPNIQFWGRFVTASNYILVASDLMDVAAWRFVNILPTNGIATDTIERLNTNRRRMTTVFGESATGVFVAEYSDARATALRYNIRFAPGSSAKWEIRIRKVTPDPAANSSLIGEVRVTAIRSVHSAAWISNAQRDRCAMIAIRVKASDQITGSLDQFNVECESPLEYTTDGSTWLGPATVDGSGDSVSRNPAWAFVDALTGGANKSPAAKSSIDGASVLAFATWATTNSFHYDDYLEDGKAFRRVVQDILRGSKASPGMFDGKYLIIHDEAPGSPVAVISTRNSRDFQAAKIFSPVPDALRLTFSNPAKGWVKDELVVYNDGFTEANAVEIEDVNIPGLVDEPQDPDSEYFSGQVYKLGRYLIACRKLRPEVFQVTQDFESLTVQRGSIVEVVHDVVQWGLGSARLVAIDGLDLTLDAAILMEASKSYQIKFRKADGSIVGPSSITLDVGEQEEITVDAVPSGVAAGDLVYWGQTSSLSVLCVVKEVKHKPDLTAVLTLIEAAGAVHDAESEEIPPFNSNRTVPDDIALQRPPSPAITAISTDETALLRETDGNLSSRIVLTVEPGKGSTDAERAAAQRVEVVEVQFRPAWTKETANAYAIAPPFVRAGVYPRELNEVAIADVQDRHSYDIRIRSLTRGGVPSEWASVRGVYVVGKSSRPPSPYGLRIERRSLRWSYAGVPDLAGFEIRHAVGTLPLWDTATRLHDGLVRDTLLDLSGRDLHNGIRTFLAKAVDTSGNYSASAAVLLMDFGPLEFDRSVLRFVSPSPGVGTWDFGGAGWAVQAGPEYELRLGTNSASKTGRFHSALDAPAWNFGINSRAWWKTYPEAWAISSHTPQLSGPSRVPYRLHFQLSVDADLWEFIRRNNAAALWPEDLSDPIWPEDLSGNFWPEAMDWHSVTEPTLVVDGDEWDHAVHVLAQDKAVFPLEILSITEDDIVDVIVEEANDQTATGGTLTYAMEKAFPRAVTSVQASIVQSGSYPNARTVEIVSKDTDEVVVKVYDASHVLTTGIVDLRITGH